jgi:UDP-N-acetylmuramoyl-L-alanyl-D-glutamate--2,6-diaminopimelate ligase
MTGTAAGGPLPVRLDALSRALAGDARVVGDGSVCVTGVQHDSRAVRPGDLFVARKGERFDGASFAESAVSRGAAAILAAPGLLDADRLPVPLVLASDPKTALAFAANEIYGRPSDTVCVVGITGTNGKTTTAHLVRGAVDGALGREACGVLGTVGNTFGDFREAAEHTTAEADDIVRTLAAMRDRGATHAAMEVSSHGLSLGRVEALHFRVAALTNLTQDHLDFHGSMEAYARAKARLFTDLRPASAVLNVDDPFGRDMASATRAAVVRVSARVHATDGGDADIVPRRLQLSARGIDMVVRTPAGDVPLASRLVGAHNADNLLLALGIVYALGLDGARAAGALAQMPGPPGRLERCDGEYDGERDDLVALVDYAHTPDALARVLAALRAVATGRVFCVFGAGGDRDRAKRGPMGAAVAKGADVAIVTSDNPRTEDPRSIATAVAEGARAAGGSPLVELDRRTAIARAIEQAAPGDVVLVAGKGHEDYQIVGNVKHPFDDRDEVRRALADRRDRRARGKTPAGAH